MEYSRREFGRLALAGVPATAFWLKTGSTLDAAAKPNSKWAGVQVGMNAPYNFGTGNYTAGDEILQKCVDLGVSAVELRAQPVELFLGSPAAIAGAANAGRGRGNRGAGAAGGGAAAPAEGRRGGGGGRAAGAPGEALIGEPACVPGAGITAAAAEPAAGGGRGRGAATPEDQAARAAAAEETRKWRAGVSLNKVKEFRKKWEDAGVLIDIVKWDGIFDFSDDEIDYAFQLSKALGARALSSEITIGKTRRLGQFADKHKMQVGYHGHAAVSPAIWEATFAEAKYNAANLDLGHFVAGQNMSPVPFLKRYPDRITHVHVKDRKYCNGPNVPFGQGDTPIKEVLQLMRANKWRFQATIEFEYPVPAGSDRMAEIAKTIEYCKSCLV
ncbi:MAG TPA: TIM barrel protein [Vicinamibacterales bacterium]|nr:TIM barrel protein [Vicinamibacterales bacterium]